MMSAKSIPLIKRKTRNVHLNSFIIISPVIMEPSLHTFAGIKFGLVVFRQSQAKFYMSPNINYLLYDGIFSILSFSQPLNMSKSQPVLLN
jgi:hypothetical protein